MMTIRRALVAEEMTQAVILVLKILILDLLRGLVLQVAVRMKAVLVLQGLRPLKPAALSALMMSH